MSLSDLGFGGEAEHEGKGDPDRDVSGARIADYTTGQGIGPTNYRDPPLSGRA